MWRCDNDNAIMLMGKCEDVEVKWFHAHNLTNRFPVSASRFPICRFPLSASRFLLNHHGQL